MELLGREIERAFRERRDVGLKTPGCERTITQLTARAREAGFRVEGTYIGTAAAEINTERILRRGSSMQGPRLSREHIANRHRQAQRTLKETAADFDELIVLDNSEPAWENRPEPRTELVIERGVVVYAARRLSSWACRVRQAMAKAAEEKANQKAQDREPSRRNEEDERVLRFDTPGNGYDRTLR